MLAHRFSELEGVRVMNDGPPGLPIAGVLQDLRLRLYEEGVVEQTYDLWEAVHPLPSLVTHWSKSSEAFLLICLRGYDDEWGSPNLRTIYEQARDEAK